MITFIENLKRKSEYKRKMIALGVAGGITAIIALVWVGTLSTIFSGKSSDVATEGVNDTVSPFSAAAENAALVYKSLLNQFQSMKNDYNTSQNSLQAMPADDGGIKNYQPNQ